MNSLGERIVAIYLINGKKIDASRGVAMPNGPKGNWMVRTSDRSAQVVNVASVVSVEMEYDTVDALDKVFAGIP